MRDLKGLIFNIQKFSIDDGPGIRTVVFFKGCPLKCKWCSNPESQMFTKQILWDRNKCVHCKTCEKTCKYKAIKVGEERVVVDKSKCIKCLLCVNNCPKHALSIEGLDVTVDDVLKVVLQDMVFYEESNGGITLSGGEVMAQPEFSKAILIACKKRGIHTAIETTSYVDTETFVDVTQYADLLLCDIKHWDSEKHKKFTGVGNELIIKNIKAASDLGRNILLRLPVIPGFNDTLNDAKMFVDLLYELGIASIQLLPFHQLGEYKYDQLGIEYEFKDKNALHREDLIEYKQVFVNAGIKVIL